jgi:hypothetical protein
MTGLREEQQTVPQHGNAGQEGIACRAVSRTADDREHTAGPQQLTRTEKCRFLIHVMHEATAVTMSNDSASNGNVRKSPNR